MKTCFYSPSLVYLFPQISDHLMFNIYVCMKKQKHDFEMYTENQYLYRGSLKQNSYFYARVEGAGSG